MLCWTVFLSLKIPWNSHPLSWIKCNTTAKTIPNRYWLIELLDNSLTHWGRYKMAAISQTTFSNAFSWMLSLWISLKFVPKVRINNIPALVQIMAWRRPGDKPLSEPMMVSLPTHICVTGPQWVKHCSHGREIITMYSFVYIYTDRNTWKLYGGECSTS